jgi:hypothetical protein
LLFEHETAPWFRHLLEIKVQAIEEVLEGKGFPSVFPWNLPDAVNRRHQLKLALEEQGLSLRGDSKLCSDFITNGETKEWPLDSIVLRMAQVIYYNKYAILYYNLQCYASYAVSTIIIHTIQPYHTINYS